MNSQALLAKIAAKYDFTKANSLASQLESKPYIRAWLNLDLSTELVSIFNATEVQFSVPYLDNEKYVKYLSKFNKIETCERRYASKADQLIIYDNTQNWFEFNVLHEQDLESTRERNKLYDDVRRVKTLREHLNLNITLLVGLWGSFSTKDIVYLKPLDNHTECSYVLDTSLTGSTQIARVSHMKREGEKRFLLIAY